MMLDLLPRKVFSRRHEGWPSATGLQNLSATNCMLVFVSMLVNAHAKGSFCRIVAFMRFGMAQRHAIETHWFQEVEQPTHIHACLEMIVSDAVCRCFCATSR